LIRSGHIAIALFITTLVSPSVGGLLAAPPVGHFAGQEGSSKDRKGRKRYTHIVEKGDTLEEIAAKYGVTIKQIKRWNPRSTKDPRHLSLGVKLKIKSKIPVRGKRRTFYVVKEGDNLRRIARKLKIDIAVLRSMNRVKGDLIHPGDKLAFLVPGPEKKSESIGRPYGGRLVNGEKMPKGPGYTYGRRSNIYGTNATITLLIECFGKIIQKYPKGPIIVVGNLSQRKGGKFGPHASHQSGRDVDIGYFHKKKFQPVKSLIRTNAKNIDARKTWFLIETFLKTRKVKYMFINHEIQKILYNHLKKRRFKQSYIDRIFQYPRKSGGGGIIQHSDGHDDHIHIRLVCPKGDKRCQD
jgi:LysM repeat protein